MGGGGGGAVGWGVCGQGWGSGYWVVVGVRGLLGVRVVGSCGGPGVGWRGSGRWWGLGAQMGRVVVVRGRGGGFRVVSSCGVRGLVGGWGRVG